jgi:hypothetical protein
VYREPHLNKKSDECSALWHIWYKLYLDKDPSAKELRRDWCKCADELGELVQEEYKKNSRYHNIKMFWSNDKGPV